MKTEAIFLLFNALLLGVVGFFLRDLHSQFKTWSGKTQDLHTELTRTAVAQKLHQEQTHEDFEELRRRISTMESEETKEPVSSRSGKEISPVWGIVQTIAKTLVEDWLKRDKKPTSSVFIPPEPRPESPRNCSGEDRPNFSPLSGPTPPPLRRSRPFFRGAIHTGPAPSPFPSTFAFPDVPLPQSGSIQWEFGENTPAENPSETSSNDFEEGKCPQCGFDPLDDFETKGASWPQNAGFEKLKEEYRASK